MSAAWIVRAMSITFAILTLAAATFGWTLAATHGLAAPRVAAAPTPVVAKAAVAKPALGCTGSSDTRNPQH